MGNFFIVSEEKMLNYFLYFQIIAFCVCISDWFTQLDLKNSIKPIYTGSLFSGHVT